MNKKEKMLRQILQNQINIMIKLHDGSRPYYEGYFKHNIEDSEELIE